MNPLDMIAAPYRIAALALAAVLIYATGYLKGAQHEALKAARFEAATQALGQAAQAHTARVEAAQRSTLERINHALTRDLKTAGDGAVGNYLRLHPRWLCNPGAGGSAVPGAAGGQPGDDGPGPQRLATDPGFIRACAEDAARLEAWRGWAMGNQIPVK